MSAVCEHVAMDAETALCVVEGGPNPGFYRICCPCCGLSGWAKDGDLPAEYPCPYCAVLAVRDDRDQP